MHQCYVEESFELTFDCYDARDREKKVDSATYTVRTADGAIVQGGVMRIGEDGHSVSFRFDPQTAGMMTVSVQWVMGADRWQERFIINVRA